MTDTPRQPRSSWPVLGLCASLSFILGIGLGLWQSGTHQSASEARLELLLVAVPVALFGVLILEIVARRAGAPKTATRSRSLLAQAALFTVLCLAGGQASEHVLEKRLAFMKAGFDAVLGDHDQALKELGDLAMHHEKGLLWASPEGLSRESRGLILRYKSPGSLSVDPAQLSLSAERRAQQISELDWVAVVVVQAGPVEGAPARLRVVFYNMKKSWAFGAVEGHAQDSEGFSAVTIAELVAGRYETLLSSPR